MVELIVGSFLFVMGAFVAYIYLKSSKKKDFEGKTKKSGLENDKTNHKKAHEH